MNDDDNDAEELRQQLTVVMTSLSAKMPFTF
jgi:predicted site-specific integrase-resolvase